MVKTTTSTLILTLDRQRGAALEVTHHGRVFSCVAAVNVLQDQFMSFSLSQDLTLVACFKLRPFKQPFNRDVVM